MALTINKVPKFKGVVSGKNELEDSTISDDGTNAIIASLIIGDDTDGSWKIIISGTDLSFQRKESGVYVSKGSVTA